MKKTLKIFGIVVILFFTIIGIKHSYDYCRESYWYYYEFLPSIRAEEKTKRHIEDSIKYVKEEEDLENEWAIARMCTFIPDAKDSVKYKNYLLIFDYDSKVADIPMTYPAGCPHYKAQVTIYKNGKLFAKPFDCEYTNGLCYEDNPADLIKEAKGIKTKSDYWIDTDKSLKEINDSLKNIK